MIEEDTHPADALARPPRVKAFLMAAGLGTRLRPITEYLPKCLVTVGGESLLDRWVAALIAAGVRQAAINNHAHPHRLREAIARINERERQRRGFGLEEVLEPVLLGSAGTIAANPRFADDCDHVLIIYADNHSDAPLDQLLQAHLAGGDPITMLLFRAENPRACGIVSLDAAGRIIEFQEKPEQPAGNLANGGVYLMRSSVYRAIAAQGRFDLGHDVLPGWIGSMRGWEWSGVHQDIGTPRSLARAREQARSRGSARLRPAVFLDRDGTLIEEVPYLSEPSRVRVLPGVPEALARLRDAGFVTYVATNQSALGRGWIDEERVRAIHDEMIRQLDRAHPRAGLDGIAISPEVPVSGDRTVIEHTDRKPGPGMLRKAAEALELDLAASWMVGDRASDVLAGRNAGCRGSVLVRTGAAVEPTLKELEGDCPVFDDLLGFTDWLLDLVTRDRRETQEETA